MNLQNTLQENDMKTIKLSFAILLAVALLAGTLAALPGDSPPGGRMRTINTASIAADMNFSSQNGQGYQYLDLFYDIDQNVVNTVTLELEVSPNGVSWYNHNDNPTLLVDNAADASGYVDSVPLHGLQFRIVANVTNTETVTPVLRAVLR
jgi:hypothetical protein